jgi:predicted O-methyltransferase YrrM
VQKRPEILGLLERLRVLRPRYLCEIGAASGGTLALLCQVATPDAVLYSIDWSFAPGRRVAYTRFARAGQRLTCEQADSHAPQTLATLENLLAGNRLDFLFIDGDHSLDGVRKDFEMYSPLVRPGGLIGFHDIVPDYRTRFGTPTAYDVGQVPEFWAGLKSRFPGHEEFIENPEQDGFGIGLVRQPGG